MISRNAEAFNDTKYKIKRKRPKDWQERADEENKKRENNELMMIMDEVSTTQKSDFDCVSLTFSIFPPRNIAATFIRNSIDFTLSRTGKRRRLFQMLNLLLLWTSQRVRKV